MWKRKSCVLIGLFLGFFFTSSAFAQDAINLNQARVWNSPVDVGSWPATTHVDALTMRPSGYGDAGVSLSFSARSRWPDYTPPGWDGPIQYTVWAGVRINGVWNVSGIVQMWRDRPSTGAPILEVVPSCLVGGHVVNNNNNFACNWVYDARWGAMMGYNPVAGEQMVFFVTAGNARGVGTVTSVRERSNVVMVTLPAGDYGDFTFAGGSGGRRTTRGDFDGDGKTDLTVFRSTTGQWFTSYSASGYTTYSGPDVGGGPGDIPVDGDFDGDGIADKAFYRQTNGQWRIFLSGSYPVAFYWGSPGDIPVPGDFDGDGKSDLIVYRASTGAWYIYSPWTGNTYAYSWGAPGDIPVPGDFDGDGRIDLTVFRPADGAWYIRLFSGVTVSYLWGGPGDIPLSADADGDGITDLVIYRPGTGHWYGRFSSTGYSTAQSANIAYGQASDVPLQGDFDGDGRADIALYRPSTSEWLILYSSHTYASGAVYIWGGPQDTPRPAPWIPLNVASISPLGAQSGSAGSAVTYTAEAVGGVGPHTYRFFVHDGTRWTLGQDWSSSNTWSFVPPAAGTYTFQVWVRNGGSNAIFDTWRSFGPFTAH